MTAKFSNLKVIGDFSKSSSNEGQKTHCFLDNMVNGSELRRAYDMSKL